MLQLLISGTFSERLLVMTGGHYTCDVLHTHDRWLRFDDTSVSLVSKKDVTNEVKMMNYVLKNDEFCIKNESFCRNSSGRSTCSSTPRNLRNHSSEENEGMRNGSILTLRSNTQIYRHPPPFRSHRHRNLTHTHTHTHTHTQRPDQSCNAFSAYHRPRLHSRGCLGASGGLKYSGCASGRFRLHRS